MMGRHAKQNELWSEPVNLARRIPADHPLRKLKSVLDLDFVRQEVAGCYGSNGNVSIDPGYDSVSRLNAINVLRGGSNQVSQSITYDGASRLDTVGSGTVSTKNNYVPNSNLIGSIDQKLSGTTKSRISRSYDLNNRLTQIKSQNASNSAVLTSFGYNYNSLGQRSTATLEDSSIWSYGYNSKGEVTSGKQRLSSGVAKEGRSYGYVYDDIGNRTFTTINGRTASYTPNSLNQYTSRTVPNYVEVSGSADPSATVRFNGNDVLRQGSYFWRDLAVSNSGAAVNLPVTISGVKPGAGTGGADILNQQTGFLFLPKTPEVYGYDADGNQTQDGRWTYTYDGENRLIKIETLSTLPVSLKQKLEFTYDWQSRRVQKKVSNWNTGTSAYVLASDTRFVWSGWNLIAEFTYNTSYTLTASYLWGADLSGTMEGAGGVGGLATITTYTGTTAGSYFPAYDGNGMTIDRSAGLLLDLTGAIDQTLAEVSLADAMINRMLVIVENEIMSLRGAAMVSPGLYRLTGLIRGRFDTPISSHPTGAEIFLISQATLCRVVSASFRPEQTWNFKLQPLAGSNVVDLATIVPVAKTLHFDSLRPPAPKNLRINGENGGSFFNGLDLAIGFSQTTWALPDFFNWGYFPTGFDPEMAAVIEIYNGATLKRTEAVGAGASFIYSAAHHGAHFPGGGAGTIKIWTVWKGYRSARSVNLNFTSTT